MSPNIYVSKEQFRRECHISKATALWLIQSGLITAIDSQRKTDRYLIARTDVENYLRAREMDPKKYRYRKSEKKPSPINIKKYSQGRARKLQNAAEVAWRDAPDMLGLSEVTRLLGYREKVVQEWRKTLGLRTVRISRNVYFPKKYLIDFMTSPEFLTVEPKSAEHLALLRRADYISV